MFTGKHRYEDRENNTIQYGRYNMEGVWAEM